MHNHIVFACIFSLVLSPYASAETEDSESNKIFRIADCEAPITTIFANYFQSDTGGFDFRSGQVSFSHRRAIQSQATSSEVEEYKAQQQADAHSRADDTDKAKCRTSDWEYGFEGFLTFSDSDFSEAVGGNLGVGLTRFSETIKRHFPYLSVAVLSILKRRMLSLEVLG